MESKLSLSFKITNWCNLNCAHCCECSNSSEIVGLLPLEKMERYLYESKRMPFRCDELLSIGGGEAMAPYMHGKPDYIPAALDMAFRYDYVPTIKTNGTWGANDTMRKKILYDLATSAYKSNKLVSLDISVDEFHDNLNGVANIICDILGNMQICMAIRICIVGFNTQKSAAKQNQLRKMLNAHGVEIRNLPNGDWVAFGHDTMCGVLIINDFNTPVYNQGRAIENNVYTSTGHPNGDNSVNCLQVDNKDIAIFNYLCREPIKNRSLSNVLTVLINHAKLKER